jgi:hypothetical protein
MEQQRYNPELGHSMDKWDELQETRFLDWVNKHLAERGERVVDFRSDFSGMHFFFTFFSKKTV